LYCLGTGFCLRNICINTLHKGDSDNNNNKWIKGHLTGWSYLVAIK
jgi:hypothetical protein